MINWAIRYKPIVDELHRLSPAWVLDVGSGPEGLQLFWRGTVVGVDLRFKRRSIHHGVIASGIALPIADGSCPFVVSCDMLEHVPPEHRRQVIGQLARVAGERLVLSFPSGSAAEEVYHSMAMGYRSSEMPLWLRQHLEYGLPDPKDVEFWLQDMGWRSITTWYESAAIHKSLLRLELSHGGKYFSYCLMRLLGPWLGPLFTAPGDGPRMRVLIKALR